MDIKKWVPWNWFKKEEAGEGIRVPVRQGKGQAQPHSDFSPVVHLHQEMDRVFNRFFNDWPWSGFGRFSTSAMAGAVLKPTLDLSATDKAYTINVEIPGVTQEDIKLELIDDTLTIRGEKKQEKEAKEKNYYRMERSYGSFQRVLSLPEDADQDSVKAKFKDGVLTVTLARKASPPSSVRHIEVKNAA